MGNIETEVEGVFASDKIQVGMDDFYVFDVTPEEFAQNVTRGRNRISFDADSPAGRYMNNGNFNKKFHIQIKDQYGDYHRKEVK